MGLADRSHQLESSTNSPSADLSAITINLKLLNLKHLDSTNLKHLDSTNLKHLDPTNLKLLDSTNLKHLDSTNLKHLDSTNLKHLDPTNLKHLDSTNLKHLDSINLKHIDSAITFNLKHLNAQLAQLEPVDILRWAKLALPNLYQTTAFGLSGLVTLDLLAKLQHDDVASPPIDVIFLDTLYHFPQTLRLVDRVRARYPDVRMHVYKPKQVESAAALEDRYGAKLWETDADLYDWVAKVEPAQRAFDELSVGAVLTGRRRSQGAKRSDLGVIDVDEAGLVKVNPLIDWTFQQVQDYVRANDVPYNELLDLGYRSIGDWHSTQPVAEGEDERAGRWKGTPKTECGIHNKRSKYAQFLMEEMKSQEQLSVGVEVGVEKVGITAR